MKTPSRLLLSALFCSLPVALPALSQSPLSAAHAQAANPFTGTYTGAYRIVQGDRAGGGVGEGGHVMLRVNANGTTTLSAGRATQVVFQGKASTNGVLTLNRVEGTHTGAISGQLRGSGNAITGTATAYGSDGTRTTISLFKVVGINPWAGTYRGILRVTRGEGAGWQGALTLTISADGTAVFAVEGLTPFYGYVGTNGVLSFSDCDDKNTITTISGSLRLLSGARTGSGSFQNTFGQSGSLAVGIENPKIKIESVTLKSGASPTIMGADKKLPFALGLSWGTTKPDQLEVKAKVEGVPAGESLSSLGYRIRWVYKLDSTRSTALEISSFGTESLTVPMISRLEGRADSYLYTPRPARSVSFRAEIVNRGGGIVDSSSNGAVDTIITQNDLGQVRQRYMDHPVTPVDLPNGTFITKKVPDVDHFALVPDAPWNDTGIFSPTSGTWRFAQARSRWAMVGPFARTWGPVGGGGPVVTAAAAKGITTRVNSVYRDPLSHWLLYRDLPPNKDGIRPVVTPASRHLWGNALDWSVKGDFALPVGPTPDVYDYALMAQVCEKVMGTRGFVHYETVSDHVHTQPFPGRPTPPSCKPATSLRLIEGLGVLSDTLTLIKGQTTGVTVQALNAPNGLAAIPAHPRFTLQWSETNGRGTTAVISRTLLKANDPRVVMIKALRAGTSVVTVRLPLSNLTRTLTVTVRDTSGAAS